MTICDAVVADQDAITIRLRTANILLITIKALANEVAKNLVLAGIGSLTIHDSESVTEDDLCSQFFVSEDDVGKNVRHPIQTFLRFPRLTPFVACGGGGPAHPGAESPGLIKGYHF